MLCESCGDSAATETVPDRRHRVPSTYRLCRDCAAEARGVLMSRAKHTSDLAMAILRALAVEPLSRAALMDAIQIEADEVLAANGAVTGLIKKGFISPAGGLLHVTPSGRRQVEPAPSTQENPPPVKSKAEAALPPLPGTEAAALRATIEWAGIEGRDTSSVADLCVAAREAIEVTARRSESLITALRAIEAALPGAPTGLRVDAIADRAVDLIRAADRIRSPDAEREALDRRYAEMRAYRDHWQAEAETASAAVAAEAEITRLRADLEGALAAEKTATADGPLLDAAGRSAHAVDPPARRGGGAPRRPGVRRLGGWAAQRPRRRHRPGGARPRPTSRRSGGRGAVVSAALGWLDAHAASVRAAQRAEERADAPPLVRAAAEHRADEALEAERCALQALILPSYDMGGGWKIETTQAARERVAKIRAAGRPGGERE